MRGQIDAESYACCVWLQRLASIKRCGIGARENGVLPGTFKRFPLTYHSALMRWRQTRVLLQQALRELRMSQITGPPKPGGTATPVEQFVPPQTLDAIC